MKERNISAKIFYLAYLLFLIHSMCTKVAFLTSPIKILFFIVPVMLSLLIIIQSKKYNRRSILCIVAYTVLTIIIYLITGEEALLCTFLFIIAAKNINIEEFIKKDIKYKIGIIIFVFLCYKLGLTTNGTFVRTDGTIRNTLGFDHPNHLGLYLFSIVCGTGYLNYNKINLKHIIIMLGSFLICYLVCDSRASQVGIITVFLLIVFNKKIKKSKVILNTFQFLPIIASLFSIITPILYGMNNSLAISLNSKLHSRIMYSSNFLLHYGINLFGHNFEYYGLKYLKNGLNVLDNAYMHILLHFGLIIFLIVMGAYIIMLQKAKKNNNYGIFIYLIPFLIYGLMERHIYEIQYNCILLYLGNIIYFKSLSKRKDDTNEENRDHNNVRK